jgi:hypothetical protein
LGYISGMYVRTVFPVLAAFQLAKASTPRIVAISLTRLRVSRVVVDEDRS